MGIKIKRATNKKGYRDNFFMVYRVPGKKNPAEKEMYGYPVRGKPPASLSIFDKGDDTYERSKAVAQEKFDSMMKDMEAKGGVESLMEQLIASKLGKEKIEYVQISELYRRWENILREKQPTKERKEQAKKDFERFADFMGKKRFLYEITEEDVANFLKSIQKTFAPYTVRDKMSLLRSTVGRFLPTGLANPFKTVNLKSSKPGTERVSHRPLSTEEYDKVLAQALKEEDPMILDLAVGSGETGMRIKDVCLLKWDDVDLESDMIKCVTHKTGTKIVIPISKELKERLLLADRTRSIDSTYVWPDAATMYTHNRSGITYRGKMLFARALFSDSADEPETVLIENGHRKEMTVLEAEDIIRGSKYQDKKKDKIIKVLWGRHYGKSTVQIARETGLSKGQVSSYLKEIFADHGIDFRPKVTPMSKTLNMLEKTRQKREVGVNAGSNYGWHSMRTAFIVKAVCFWKLPKEIVKMIVGHKDFETTKRFYLNPTDPVMKEVKELMDEATDTRHAKFGIIHEIQPDQIAEPKNDQPALFSKTRDRNLSLAEIIKGLSPEAKAKIPTLPVDAKAELKKTTSIEDAELLLSLY